MYAASTSTDEILELVSPGPRWPPCFYCEPPTNLSCYPLSPTFRTFHGCPPPMDDDLLVPPLLPSSPSSHHTHVTWTLLNSSDAADPFLPQAFCKHDPSAWNAPAPPPSTGSLLPNLQVLGEMSPPLPHVLHLPILDQVSPAPGISQSPILRSRGLLSTCSQHLSG